MEQVLITGATGFIGSRLCEVMALTGRWKARALVHSTASATRIARFPIDFVVGDLCDSESVDRAIQGCTAVVHLARGDRRVMRTGLKNVLRAALKHRCSRMIHLSSVGVYGNNPPPESVTEAAPVRRIDNSYGREKIWQEKCALRFGKRHGLPIVILRPAEVYGAFSNFTQAVITRIQAGKIAILNGGQHPCNLVYVDNLVEAILLSLSKSAALGEIFFVTDPEPVSWRNCLEDHAAWVGVTLPSVAQRELISPKRERVVLDSLKLLPRVLLSGEARRLLRCIPLIKLVEANLYKAFQYFPSVYKQKLRVALSGPLSYSKDDGGSGIFYSDDPIMALQGRRVAHSSEKAKRLLGYSAPVAYSEGMALTEAWFRSARMLPPVVFNTPRISFSARNS